MYSNRDLLAKTLQAEAGNQGLGGMLAVGSVIANRIGTGQSWRDIILAPGQFSAWNSVTGYAGGEQGQDMDAIKPSKDAYAAADAILSGNYTDITGGATHYYNPDISQPSWGASAGGEWKKIGAHVFGKADAPRKRTASMDGQQPTAMQPTAQQMQQMQQQPRGLMGFLRDPRTRQVLTSLSRSEVGERLGRIAEADVQRQQQQQTANRTAAWLRTQPNGEPYATAIESGMDARTVYTQYMRDAAVDKDPNVQSRTMLPDNSGSVVTMRDGTQFVLTAGGQKLTGADADAFVQKAQSSYVQQQQDIYGARRSGTLGADIDLGGAAAAATEEGKQRPKMVKDFMEQASLVKSNIVNMTDAIKAIDRGAKSGIVYNMLPNITGASASLKNAMDRMGLDVIGSVTFGALSEGEMRLAMETAVPRNLGRQELRAWLVEKQQAQQKALEALNNAALWFASGGTLEGYLKDQQQVSPANETDNPLGLE